MTMDPIFQIGKNALSDELIKQLSAALEASDILCAGCGWGSSVSPALLKKVLDFPGPIVLDADGLNVLSRNRKLWNYRSDAVLTPHPGEAARLLGMDIAAVQADRPSAAAHRSGADRIDTPVPAGQ